MDQNITSDETMAVASSNFDFILQQIKNSCLNYQVQITPFTAVISLKKTLAKNINGVPLSRNRLSEVFSHGDNSDYKFKYRALETEFNKMHAEYKNLLHKYTSACDSLNDLEETLKEKDDIITNLEALNVSSKAVADKLNKHLVEKIGTFDTEKKLLIKEYEGQVKMWRKELGNANRKHIKLQKKFEHLEISATRFDNTLVLNEVSKLARPDVTERYKDSECISSFVPVTVVPVDSCSICAAEINDYVPEYICGLAMDPACDVCKREANLDSSDLSPDPYSSFSADGMPVSLVSHWFPPHSKAPQSLHTIPSLRSHHVSDSKLEKITLKGDLWQKLEAQFQEEKRNGCKQS